MAVLGLGTKDDLAWEALLGRPCVGNSATLDSERESAKDNWCSLYDSLPESFWTCLVDYCKLGTTRYLLAKERSEPASFIPWEPLGAMVCMRHLQGFKKTVDLLAQRAFETEKGLLLFPVVTSPMVLSTALSSSSSLSSSHKHIHTGTDGDGDDLCIDFPPVGGDFKAHYLAYVRFIADNKDNDDPSLSLVELIALHSFVDAFVYLFQKCRQLGFRLRVPPRLLRFLLHPECCIRPDMAQQIFEHMREDQLVVGLQDKLIRKYPSIRSSSTSLDLLYST